MWAEYPEQIVFPEKLNLRIQRFFSDLFKSILETAGKIP
jgi:hypothetical protein